MILLAESMVELSDSGVSASVTLGISIAVACSWQRNRSILWAILAGCFNWIYILYFALTRKPDELKPSVIAPARPESAVS